ncbi:MAG TPA: heparinase II/III family protein [Phycisphaerae bacterium]|nr:heparinase II/III family protein [Phycisphaerae bacterium]
MNKTMRLSVRVTLLALAISAGARAQQAQPKSLPGDWLKRIRTDHPRMFFNKETWPKVKAYVLKHEKAYYEKLKRVVAGLPLQPDRKTCESGSNRNYGPYAQRCAFVWLMEGDKTALAKAKNYMMEGMRFYNRCSSNRQTVNWYSASRVCCLTAYDWIYSELTADERKEFARGMVKHYIDCLAGRSFPRQNRSDHTSGFYGPTNLAWYVGLAFHGDGLVGADAAKLLQQGCAEHVKLLNYRAASAGDDGGTGSVAVGYGLGMYPWAEFNFMHTFNSSTGLAVEEAFDHLSLFPQWVLWNHLPGNMSWGLADSVPAGKMAAHFLDLHMLNVAHFYAVSHPRRSRLAMWVHDKLTRQPRDDYWWPLAPLLVWRCGELPEPAGPDTRWPHAQNFENMGLVMMRAGLKDDDVNATFVAGGDIPSHRHYDQGHFIIFRKAHLALDSGDYGPRERNEHLTEYLYRTVAHNSILIHAPQDADQPPKVWGGKARTLDGGQYRLAGKQIAFETNDAYTYAAVDVTACYDPRKCKQAVRQFLFIYPDTFVICDRVTATKPEYKKVWLLHSESEPKVDGATFRTEYAGSSLVGAVLLPAGAKIEAVGGPGREFLSAGKNRAQTNRHKGPAGTWRIEASPATEAEADVFLTVLRAGDAASKDALDTMLAKIDSLGVPRVACQVKMQDGRTATMWFTQSGAVGGHLAITGDRKIDAELTRAVQPQAGIPPERK